MATMFLSPSDISRGIERLPIRLASTTDEELGEASDFVYTLCNIPGPSISRDAFEEQIEGCKCADMTTCGAQCTCVSRYGGSYEERARNPHDRNLKPIFECNKTCQCSPKCHNRVVQGGVKINLEIFRTVGKGFGLRSLVDISKDTFVCEYVGEVLTFEEAKQRSKQQDSSGNYYILTVKEHVANGEVITTYIDPMFIGNVGRFINHSCGPNLYMVPVRANNSIPRVGLFAFRDIKAGEELSFDYSGNIRGKGSGKENDGDTKARRECLCGSEFCSGYLPFDDCLFT